MDGSRRRRRPGNQAGASIFCIRVAARRGRNQRNQVCPNHPQPPALKALPDKEPDLREEFDPSERSQLVATATIASTYVYFLIFAQFGFLKALAVLGPDNFLLRPILAVMAAAGIAGSVLMARWFHENRGRGQVMAGFVVAAAAAGLTWAARTPAVFFLCAALTGAGTGMVTVGLAGLIRREVGGGRLGRCIGLGTGLEIGRASCRERV